MAIIIDKNGRRQQGALWGTFLWGALIPKTLRTPTEPLFGETRPNCIYVSLFDCKNEKQRTEFFKLMSKPDN